MSNPGSANLSAWWKCNETSGTRYDAHALNNLSDINTVGYNTGLFGNASSHIYTNQERLSIVDNAALSVTGSFTFCGWFRPTGFGNGLSLFGKGSSHAAYSTIEYVAYELLSSGEIRWAVSTGSGGVLIGGGNHMVANAWNFLVCGYNSGTGNIFKKINNGSLIQASLGGSPANKAYEFALGGIPSSLHYDGRIDNSCFYNGRALTEAEMTFLWNGGAGVDYETVVPPVVTVPRLGVAMLSGTAMI